NSTTVEAVNPNGAANFPDAYYDRIVITNQTFQDLLDDINFALARAGLGTKFQAQPEEPGSTTVKIVSIDPTITSFTVTVGSTADPAFRDLGFQLSSPSVLKNGVPEVAGAKSAPVLVGQLTDDASFDLTLDGVTKTITIKLADTTPN